MSPPDSPTDSPLARQAAFAERLLQPGLPIPQGLTAPRNASLESRFAIHRNNAVAGLTEVLAGRFPVCRRLVGDAFFAAVAGAFVRASPPRSPILAVYGDAFADFIRGFPPAEDLPYLADVARLEYAMALASDAADAPPIAIDALGDVPPARRGDIVIVLHPAMQLVTSRFAIVSLWRTNTIDADVRVGDPSEAQVALVTRPALDVLVRQVSAATAAFLAALAQGRTLASASEAGSAAADDFDLADNIGALFTLGLAAGISVSPGG